MTSAWRQEGAEVGDGCFELIVLRPVVRACDLYHAPLVSGGMKPNPSIAVTWAARSGARAHNTRAV